MEGKERSLIGRRSRFIAWFWEFCKWPRRKRCGCEPIETYVVMSGNFEGNKTIDDYYPDLMGSGCYAHPKQAGEFDTGNRVGGGVQIVGIVSGNPKKCKLSQSLFVERENIDGDTDRQGLEYDDIRKSGRDETSEPFKQDFDEKTSFADVPSYSYGPRAKR